MTSARTNTKNSVPAFFVFLLALIHFAHISPSAANAPSETTRPQAPASSSSESNVSPPSITSQPENETVNAGGTATFTVLAAGSSPLAFQWLRNGAIIPGATSDTYTTPVATIADNGAQFSITISNHAGQVTSRAAMLTVDSTAQPERASQFLSNSYVGLRIGYINYDFSNAQAQPGFQAQSVQVPHLAVGVFLIGHEFNKYLSVQLLELRPVRWVEYKNINGAVGNNSVWMNIGGLTAKGRLPLGRNFSLYGEGGLGLVSRRGFEINQSYVVTNAIYATFLFGAGVDFRVNQHWDLLGGITVAPGNSADKQPATEFFSGGFNYTLRHVTSDQTGAASSNGPIWPKNFIQLDYITNALGYGVNNFLTKGKVPVFFPGIVNVENGFAVDYRRNLFHARRFFALDLGAQVSSWKSQQNGERFYTVALYPVARVPLIRTNPFEFYFSYSLAGPAFISRTNIDDRQTGRSFTFQDYIGLGSYWGRKRRITAEIRIEHYSNGNIFPENPGITIPLGFSLGMTF